MSIELRSNRADDPMILVANYMEQEHGRDAQEIARSAREAFEELCEETAPQDLRNRIELAIACLSQHEASREQCRAIPEHVTNEVTGIVYELRNRLDQALMASSNLSGEAVSVIDTALGRNGKLEESALSGNVELKIRDAFENVLICLRHPIESRGDLTLRDVRAALQTEIDGEFRNELLFEIVTAYGAGWRRNVDVDLESSAWTQRWAAPIYELQRSGQPIVVKGIDWLNEYVNGFREVFAESELHADSSDDMGYHEALSKWADGEADTYAVLFMLGKDKDLPQAAALSAWNPFARTLRQHLAVAIRGSLNPSKPGMFGEEFGRSLLGQRLRDFVSLVKVAYFICEVCNADYLRSSMPKGRFDKFPRDPDGSVFGVYAGAKCLAGHTPTEFTPIWERDKRFIAPDSGDGVYQAWVCYQCANAECRHLFDLDHEACPLCRTLTKKKKKRTVFRLTVRHQQDHQAADPDSDPYVRLGSIEDPLVDLISNFFHEWYERYQESPVTVRPDLVDILDQPEFRQLNQYANGAWDLRRWVEAAENVSIDLPSGYSVRVVYSGHVGKSTPSWRLEKIPGT